MTIEELLASKKAKADAMQKILADNPETMDAETAAQFDALDAEVANIDAQIKRHEKAAAARVGEQSTGRQTRTASDPVPQRARQEDDLGGFSSISEFASCVIDAGSQRGVDDRLTVLGAPSNPHRETKSNDGFMVPPAMSSRIFEIMTEEVDLMNMVDGEPTGSNTVKMIADETTPWGSTGIQAYWGAEASQLQRSRLETKGKAVDLHKVHAFVEVTDELQEDAPLLDSRLTKGAGQAINWKVNSSILEGTGAGMPLGMRTAASKIAVAKESGQAANTVVLANVAKMYSRCLDPSKAVWLANQDTLPQMMQLKYDDGAPAWLPPNQGIASAPGGFLMGRPIMFSDHCETLGAEGDLMFINPKGYYLPQKKGIKFSSSLHLLFDYDTGAFKWTFRVGGRPYLSTAVSPNKGSSTRSHCVTLAVRS